MPTTPIPPAIPGLFELALKETGAGEFKVTGTITGDSPFEVLDGYGHSARRVRSDTIHIVVSRNTDREGFRVGAACSGQQVRKDGTLGRDVRGVHVALTDLQRTQAIEAAKQVYRAHLQKELDAL